MVSNFAFCGSFLDMTVKIPLVYTVLKVDNGPKYCRSLIVIIITSVIRVNPILEATGTVTILIITIIILETIIIIIILETIINIMIMIIK